MRRLLWACSVAGMLGGCGNDNNPPSGMPEPSTNVGMKPGTGRVDTGGGVSAGDSPQEVRSAVTGTATYENPGTNTSPATNTPAR